MSDDMAEAEDRRLVVRVGDSDLTPALRAALEGLPCRVEFVTDAEVRIPADPGDLLLSIVGKEGLVESATPRPADPPRAVRARPPKPFAPNPLYDEARSYVEELLNTVREGGSPDVARGRPLAERIHTALLRDNALINRSLEPHDTYDLASHSANVAILAGKIALGMVSTIEDAVEVVHAGLVHDIGMARLPESLLRNPGTWSDGERQQLQEHPILGAEILENCAPKEESLRRAVLQEHERARGQGYPHGLLDRDLDPIARILGVADVFEALSHPRTYRSPFTALQALERVVGMQEEYFSPQVVSALVNEISAFPLDSFVQISSGEIGRVVATDPGNMLRPRVELVWDRDWNRIEDPLTLDLASRPDLTVARALLDSELPIT